MQDKSLLLDASLERAAEVLGDITGPVMSRYYAAHPEVEAAFDHHGGVGNRRKLEAEMVENALYWAMNWLDRPSEIRIQLGSSVPHHQETLKVTLGWYRSLLETVIDVIAETIPADRPDELELWRQIRRELGELVEVSQSTYVPHSSVAA